MATDFSEGSDEALERAIEGAKSDQAAIEILHVIELSEEFPFGTVYFEADYGALYARQHPELAVVEEGFLEKDDGFDRVTWQLLERR